MAKNDEKPVRLEEGRRGQQGPAHFGKPGPKIVAPSATLILPPQWIAPPQTPPASPATPPQSGKKA